MSNKKKPDLLLVCTGLGHVNRGFETYINDLAIKLKQEKLTFTFSVCLGKKINGAVYNQKKIFNIHRKSKLLSLFSENTAFEIEQLTFFFGIIPSILFTKIRAIYLGEYNLYCYLFKFRKWFNLNFSLVLYTGGQAVPGLFDLSKDYVHHITDIYYDYFIKKGVPASRQFLLPHFINFPFSKSDSLTEIIYQKANGKKILLSVGQIDMTINLRKNGG